MEMNRFIFSTIVVFIFLSGRTNATWKSNFYISPNGNDSYNCTDRLHPCQTLENVLRLVSEIQNLNSTRIELANGNYTVANAYNFTDVDTFALVGNGSKPDDVQITCKTNVGLSFVLSQNLVFQGFKLRNCGGWHPTLVEAEKPYARPIDVMIKTALDFRYCRTVEMTNVDISSSPGLGANLRNVAGIVNVNNCVFADNKAVVNRSLETDEYSRHDYVHSGGGVSIALSQYGFNSVNVTPSKHDSYQHNNAYVFSNCHFLKNKASWLNRNEFAENNVTGSAFVQGGGLSIYFRGNASNCTVQIQSCEFLGNLALWGGGLQIELRDETHKNHFHVEHTTFQNNTGKLAGGGARVGNKLLKGLALSLNKFTFRNCSFVNNFAMWGGGTSLYGTSISLNSFQQTDQSLSQFFFNNSRWHGNNGTVGAAVGISLYNFNKDHIGPERSYHIVFNNCTFVENRVKQLDENVRIGQGCIYSVEVPITFNSSVTFIDNDNTALALDESTVEIHDYLAFIKNKGYRGGAVAMYGRSKLVFHENSEVLFLGNICKDKGGALYIDAPGPPSVSLNATFESGKQSCFFAYQNSSLDFDEWKTTVIFENNTAPGYNALGNSVYATTLKNCRRPGESREHNSFLHWKFIKFSILPKNYTSLKSEVATDPVDMTLYPEDWNVAPSEVFNARVNLIDEIDNIVSGVINITIGSSSVKLDTPSTLFLTQHGIISNLSLIGAPESNYSVTVSYVGNQVLERTMIGIVLKRCYPGYTVHDNNSCVCMVRKEKGIANCSWDKRSVYLKPGYWAGETRKERFVTYFCPTGYCLTSGNEILYTPGNVCAAGRDQKSVLCGKCKTSYSVRLGSETCSNKCTNWHLFLLLAYGIGLFLLTVGIMSINLDFFTGYLNAWLYSYQVMSVLTPDGFQFGPVINFLINLAAFRIKVGNGICFAKGLTDADKLVALYILPTYLLIVVAILSRIVSVYPDWFLSRRLKAPFRAVCTIIVLCYTDITLISLKILRPASLGGETVLYADGSIGFFTGIHIVYGIIAIIYMVGFVLLLPLVLMFRPFIASCLRPVFNINRCMLFLDALQSCFKDAYRWCASFYFLSRFLLLAIDTFMPSGQLKRALLEGASILILMVFSFLRPYKEAQDVGEDEESFDWINKSDVALLTALSLIAVFSTPLDESATHNYSSAIRRGLTLFVRVLGYVPLLVLGLVVYRTIKRRREVRRRRGLVAQDPQHALPSDIFPEVTSE